MDDEPEPAPAATPERPDTAAARHARLALAMRANLRRRKVQVRGREAAGLAAVEPAPEDG